MYHRHQMNGQPANIKRRNVELSLLALILSLVMVSPAVAGVETFVEDFTTTQYMDPLNTTADWDTVAGEIKLFPYQMSIAGNFPSAGVAQDVVVVYNHAFLADGAAGLVIVDITDVAAPVLTGVYDTPGEATALALSGDYAFVADGSGGMAVLDISNLSVPALAGSFEPGGSVTGIAVDGNYAYLASGSDGLLVLDITDPTNPGVAGDFNTLGNAIDVEVSGNHAFVATSNGSLQVFDITDPAGPAPVGSYEPGGSAWAVAVDGDLAVLAAGGAGLWLIDIEDPTSPSPWANLPITGAAYDVTIDGDMVYVASGGNGLVVADISDPGMPMVSKSLDTPGSAVGVSFGYLYAFVADGVGGMQIIEMRYPESYPELWGSHDTAGNGLDIEVSGRHAYIALGSSGLEVVDVSDPVNPSLAGSFDLPGFGEAKKIDLEGNLVYVAYGDSGLVVVDVSDPAVPTLAGILNSFIFNSEPEPFVALDVAVDGNVAYLVTEGDGLLVVDVSDPSLPTKIGQYEPPVFSILGIVVGGNYAYLACGDDGMVVVDISDPTTPAFAGSLIPNGESRVNDLCVEGDVAFVDGLIFSDYGAVLALDITDPTTPAWDLTGDGKLLLGEVAQDLIVSGPRVFAAFEDEPNFEGGFVHFAGNDSLFGFDGIDIYYSTFETARGLGLTGDFVYLVGDFGLEVVRVFSGDFLADLNIAQSLPIASDVAAVRISTTQTGSITWEVGPDFLEPTQAVTPGLWTGVNLFGGDLVWQANLYLGLDGASPTCSQLQLDFMFSYATIDSIVDVPGDQGGWTRTYFTGSGRDLLYSSDPVEDYIVWRRVDPEMEELGIAPGDNPETSVQGYQADFPELPLVERSGRVYLEPGQKSLAGFPPGTWEIVGSFPAMAQEQYIYLTPTAGDSTAADPSPSVYVVSAHRDITFWVSPPDSGYSLDNIAPGVPTTVTASYEAAQVSLDWDDSPAHDFQYYRIYRDTSPGFVPSPANLVQEVAGSSWVDPTQDPWGYYYQITALDHAGNESDAASPESVSGVQSSTVPARTILLGAVPNPFNPSTKLSFEMAAAGHARLKVYDTAGRLVATLVNERRDAGLHEMIWDGRDNAGRMSAAGVYLYCLEVGDFAMTKRMTLVK